MHVLDGGSAGGVQTTVGGRGRSVSLRAQPEMVAVPGVVEPEAVVRSSPQVEGPAPAGGLSAVATGELVRAMLGDVAAPELIHAIWRMSGGDPDGIATLAIDAKETGCIALDAEAWRLTAPLPVRRLSELIGESRSTLSAAASGVADVLALAGPLPFGLAAALTDPAGVRELEERGLARIRRDEHGGCVVLSDPMYVEVLLAELGADRRRVLLSRIVDAYDGWRRPVPVVSHLARWQLELDRWGATELEDAAWTAYAEGDADLAGRLAARAADRGGGSRSRMVLGLVLTDRGDGASAAPMLRPADSDPGPAGADPDVGIVAAQGVEPSWTALAEAHRLAVGTGRWDAAITHLTDHAAGTLGSERGQLLAGVAVLHALRGDPCAADRAATEVLGSGEHEERSDRLATVASAMAAFDRLGPPDAGTGAHRLLGGVTEPGAGDTYLPITPHLLAGIGLLRDRRRTPQDRLVDAQARLETALRSADTTLGWWLAVTGWLSLEGGDLDGARDRLVDALLTTERIDPVRMRPWVAADLAVIAASTGSTAEAQRRLDQASIDRPSTPRVTIRCAIAQALIDAELLGIDAGAEHALAAGDAAAAAGLVRDAVDAWHLAVRLGRAEGVAERLAGSDVPADHPDAVLAVRHADRLLARDAVGLAAVARDLAAAGRYLVAAEAAAQGRRLGGDRTVVALASGLAATCSGPPTPTLDGVPRVELGPRRREVARLAMQGVDGSGIATRLGVSVRTVENHLVGVYRLLGIRGRRQLTSVYRPDLAPFVDQAGAR